MKDPIDTSRRPRLFADLHCHPTLYGFNRLRNGPDDGHPERFDPWRVFPSDGKKMAAGAHASAYSQCNFAQLTEGRVRLVFASFTPIERGFLMESSAEGRRRFAGEALRLVSGATALRSARQWIRGDRRKAAQEAGRILRNHGPLRVLLDRLFAGYSAERIGHLLSPEYDYWDELLREYRFLRDADGQRRTVSCQLLREGAMVDRSVEGGYQLIRDGEQLRRVIEGDGDELAVLLTIEGGHVLTLGPDQEPLPERIVFERIAELRRWEHPVFLLTLAHHFDNGVCGHAHTIPDAGAAVIDQSRRMGEGLERRGDLGLRVIRELLDLDGDLRDRGDRRILMDIKHFSPRTRQQYYDEIVRPYNRRHADLDAAHCEARPPLPVVGTHMGYAGIATLQEMIDSENREDDHWLAGPYYAWGMNLSDEDVRMVHDTRGLIGVIFDRRVVGVAPGQRIPDEQWPMLIWRQLTGMVDVIMLDDRRDADDRRGIWDRLCIGSDFDGFMHPVPCYPTVLEYQTFADDLARLLEQHRHTRMIAEVGVETIVEKVAWRNAYEFALRHAPAMAGAPIPGSAAS